MKRKLQDRLGDSEEDQLLISGPPIKRITMCYNTPKEAKDEKKKLMKTSKRKLKQIAQPESNLCRSLLINNVYKRLQSELRQEKNNKYYGYAFNPRCPFGFGAGIREISQRKRSAKLQQVLTDKWRAHEQKRHDNFDVIDNNTSFMEIFDNVVTTASKGSDEQLLNLVESMDVGLCCDSGTQFSHNCDKAIIPCDKDEPVSHQQSCDQLPVCSTLESHSDLENEEIDVCFCEDDQLNSQTPVTTASQLLQEQQAQTSNFITATSLISRVASAALVQSNSYFHDQSIHVDTNHSSCAIASNAASLPQQSNSDRCTKHCDFPPKEQSSHSTVTSREERNKNNTSLNDHLNEFTNSVFHFNRQGNYLNGFSPSMCSEPLSVGSLCRQGVFSRVLSPFCHPLFVMAHPLHNKQLSDSSTHSSFQATTNSYVHKAHTDHRHINYTQNTSSSNTSYNMVTCT